MTSSLALHGGKKLINKPLQSYNSIGKEGAQYLAEGLKNMT